MTKEQMTNKLPVAGKRYKNKSLGSTHKVLQCYPCIIVNPFTESLDSEEFWHFYEELPDQKPTTEESLTVDKAQEALEELKKDLADFGEGLLDDDVDGEGFDIYSSAMKLVNALESNMYTKPDNMPLVNQTIQETPVSSIPEHTSKSIWKPISELPDIKYQQLIIKWGDGENEIALYDTDQEYFVALNLASEYCNTELREWCYLSDFINHTETLEKRIERLEQLSKGK